MFQAVAADQGRRRVMMGQGQGALPAAWTWQYRKAGVAGIAELGAHHSAATEQTILGKPILNKY